MTANLSFAIKFEFDRGILKKWHGKGHFLQKLHFSGAYVSVFALSTDSKFHMEPIFYLSKYSGLF